MGIPIRGAIVCPNYILDFDAKGGRDFPPVYRKAPLLIQSEPANHFPEFLVGLIAVT